MSLSRVDRWIALGMAFGIVLTSVPAGAQDAARRTVPYRWLDQALPEDLPALKHPDYFTDLEKAKAQIFTGRYKLALATLATLKDADPVQVALLKGTALGAVGRSEEAMAALSSPDVADQPSIQIARAKLLADLGRVDDAIAVLDQHLRANPQSIPGHYYLGACYELKGNLDKARTAYGWFDADPQRFMEKWRSTGADAFANNAEEIVLMGRAYDRLYLLTEVYRRNEPQLHNEILNIFVTAYDTVDRNYWPAHLAAAEYFLSHDMTDEAMTELDAAVRRNPSDRDTLKLIGLITVSQFNFDGADWAVSQMRQVNPTSAAADLLDCRNLLQQRSPQAAESLISRVLQQQPKNLEALGLSAAIQSLLLHDDQTQAILKQVDQFAPGDATARLEVAEALSAMRQYPRSADMYQETIKRAPWWPAAYNGLGLLYTQSGDEEDAKRVLEQARMLDPFNLRTTNYLRLLDQMDKMARKETAHFIVMYDEKLDPMVPEYFGDYLESVYPEVCGEYHHEPAKKTIIEVFPTHDAFSVRTTGTPWIATVGASTGRVIALVAPRTGDGAKGPYNWAQVLRHEFTHTVTLSATDNRIQHWMTEGLAVQEEHSPLQWAWVPMLYQAVNHKTLFTLDNITWGFVRPKRPSDRQLAYAQSFWMCQFIEQKWGHDSILKLLAEARAGKTQEESFTKVLGKDSATFSAEFFQWADSQIAKWGYDAETTKKYEALRKQGEELIKGRQYAEALPIWQQIAELRPVDPLPQQRLAALYLTKEINQKDKALEHLIALDKVELKNNLYAKRIAMLYRDLGQLKEATQYALQAVYIDPYDLRAHELLAEINEKAGDEAGLAKEKRVIPVLSQWIETNRHRSDVPEPSQ